jgi:hypothetical protein
MSNVQNELEALREAANIYLNEEDTSFDAERNYLEAQIDAFRAGYTVDQIDDAMTVN